MVPSMVNNERLVAYFTSLNLSKTVSKQLSRDILHWVDHKGIEFAVSRLKDLKTQRIHFENRSKVTLVRSHADLSPVGSFRALWGTKLSFRDALQALNIYTSVVSDVITKKQAEKFVQSVNFVGPTVDTIEFAKVDERVVLRSFHKIEVKHPLGWIRGTGKRAPVVRDGIVKTVPENSLGLQNYVKDVIPDESTRSLLHKHAGLISRMLKVDGPLLRAHIRHRTGPWPTGEELYSDLKGPPTIGKIGLIQERGMKLRAVANPFRLWQHVLSPLGDLLYGVLKQLEWDCTFDQGRGVTFVQEKLSQGCTMYAFDLSNATDRFPLNTQIDALNSLLTQLENGLLHEHTRKHAPHRGKPSDVVVKGEIPDSKRSHGCEVSLSDLRDSVTLLQALSRGKWEAGKLAPFNDGDQFLQWKTGQPLGLYPSFALFAYTHGMLLRTIENELSIEDSFRVLGDDVIISDPEVARMYKEKVISLGCQISESKSLVSHDMGEFAGKVITRDGIVPVEKWKNFSPTNPFGPLEVLGVKGLKFVPPKWRKRVRKLASLPKPFGLELNPDGIPLQDRVDTCLDKLYRVEETEITDYTLSHEDLEDQLALWWKSTYFEGNGSVRSFIPNSKDLPRVDDLPTHDDRVSIEHYNAYIHGLKGWETPSIERPVVLAQKLADRTASTKFSLQDRPHLFKLLKTFHSFIKSKE